MNLRLIKNDWKNNKLISGVILMFLLTSAMMISLTVFLSVNLIGAVDHLMEKAQTPHFLQMHAGKVHLQEIGKFASKNDAVESWQIQNFLNIDSGQICLNGQLIADSTQDNGLCIQNKRFDFLLDMDNQPIRVSKGEIYVPVCYRGLYHLETGQKAQIAGKEFRIAGFLRDSQMNSMLASSKRFLVESSDYEEMKSQGEEEYFIEFRLKNATDTGRFATQYAKAGLDANGPAITDSLIRMMNALSEGMMIAIILLVSILVVVIALLCIRFTLLAKLEEEYTEIGTLKAMGMTLREIRKIYLTKYFSMTIAGGIAGVIAAELLRNKMLQSITVLYGKTDHVLWEMTGVFLGILFMIFIVWFYVSHVLKRINKISPVLAVCGRSGEKQKDCSRMFLFTRFAAAGRNTVMPILGIKDVLARKKIYFTMLLVSMFAVALMIIPKNIYNTISSEKFATHMGIGKADIRMDVQQSDHMQEKAQKIGALLEKNKNVEKYTILNTRTIGLIKDGSVSNLKVELGDHSTFPVSYVKGTYPVKKNEIAMSSLNAKEYQVTVGDFVDLRIDGKPERVKVCGIYSDITNGGKTAKACFQAQKAPVMWSILYASIKTDSKKALVLKQISEGFPDVKCTDIREYIQGTYGQTLKGVKSASFMADGIAAGLLFLITVLFVRMLIAKDRETISIIKAVGFCTSEIRSQYITGCLAVLVLGIAAGTLLANMGGEKLTGVIFSSMGAESFSFVIRGSYVYLFVPFLAVVTVILAVFTAAENIRKVEGKTL